MPTLTDIHKTIRPDLDKFEEMLKSHLSSATGAVNDLGRYSAESKGKRIRPALGLLSGVMAGHITEKNLLLAVAIELIHMATLVHDDVIDYSELRRGRPTVNASWGNTVAILFGDYLLIEAFSVLCSFKENDVLSEVADMSRKVCEGEIYQLSKRFDINMSEKDYIKMVSLKTASLFSTACRLSASLSGASLRTQKALDKFGKKFGMAYQIIDDCLDITGSDTGKNYLKDLEGGKITLPLIKALSIFKGEEHKRLATAFRSEEIERCRKKILSTDAIDLCLKEAAKLMKSARDDISDLPDGHPKDAFLQLSELVLEKGAKI